MDQKTTSLMIRSMMTKEMNLILNFKKVAYKFKLGLQ